MRPQQDWHDFQTERGEQHGARSDRRVASNAMLARHYTILPRNSTPRSTAFHLSYHYLFSRGNFPFVRSFLRSFGRLEI